MDLPIISIIIRIYNDEHYIRKAIQSALNQDFNNYEIIVINDGSTDSTQEIIDEFSDEKLIKIQQENKGMIESGYIGLKQARGEYVIFLDGDDEFLPNTIKELHDNIGNEYFAYSDYYEVKGENKKIVSLENIFNSLACGILFKKEVLNEIGFWRNDLIFPEYDLLLRILQKNKGVYVRKALYIYNRHKGSFTADKDRVRKGREELFKIYGEIEGLKDYD
tara:strand:+ start:148 stop:807 length:660 start_codon:yes stop_codon:yes gene_type:complete